MALSPTEQELLDLANAGLPDWFKSDLRAQEDMAMAARQMGLARAQAEAWFGQGLIGDAEGIFLDEHAKDRGTGRQAAAAGQNESDPELRARIRSVPEALIPQSFIDAAQRVLTAAGVAGSIGYYEAQRDCIYLIDELDHQVQNLDGGTFTGPDGTGHMTFLPSTPFAHRPFSNVVGGRIDHHRIEIGGADNAGNDGVFQIVGLVGDAVRFHNPSGVAGADVSASWSLFRYDTAFGQQMEFSALCYLYDPNDAAAPNAGPADRLAPGNLRGVVLMLPLGTSLETARAVEEAVRQVKAAGVVVTVERRTV